MIYGFWLYHGLGLGITKKLEKGITKNGITKKV
jgi:hypothetical protein